jgi:hypothetical protein
VLLEQQGVAGQAQLERVVGHLWQAAAARVGAWVGVDRLQLHVPRAWVG